MRELENETSPEAWERKNESLRRLRLRTIPNPNESRWQKQSNITAHYRTIKQRESRQIWRDSPCSYIVGYQSIDRKSTQFNAVGMGFITAGQDGTFKLGDIKPEYGCWDSASDLLSELASDGSNPMTYIYYGEWEGAGSDEIGWWDYDWNDIYNDESFSVGTGFVGNFSTKNVAFQQAGQVLKGTTTLNYAGDPAKEIDPTQFCVLGNIIPSDIKLGNITPATGCWDSGSDILTVLSSDGSNPISYVYYGAWEGAGTAEIGWWDFDFNDMYNDEPIAAGSGLIGNFSAKDVKLVFDAVCN